MTTTNLFPRLASWLLVLLGAGRTSALAAAPRPPNILMVFCDDLTMQAISAYQHPLKLLTTPHMDRLASQGMLFERCLVPNSICGPSRAVIQTGKYSHLNGFLSNRDRFNGAQQTFPKLLQKAGYQTALIGKWHLESDPTGFDHWHILPGQGIYYNPPMIRNGEQVTHQGYTTDLITDFSLEWLKQRDQSKPFLLMTQHKAPHGEWAPALRHLGWNEDRPFPEPATLFDDYSGRGRAEREQDMSIAKSFTPRHTKETAPPYLNTAQRHLWDAYYEPRNARMRAANLTGRDLVRWRYQRYLHDYLGTVKAVDESLGRLLQYLDDNGLAANTLVVLSSDQGFYLGEHGWYDKRWIYEQSVTTPLIVRWPGITAPGSRERAMVSVLDLPETFLDAAGVGVPANMQGRSLRPILAGRVPDDWRKSFYYHFYEYPGPNSVRRHYGVVTERYKLFHFYEPDMNYWTLIDRERDPNELKNVYDDASYVEARQILQAELQRLRTELKVPAEGASDTESPRRASGGGKKKADGREE